MASLTALNETLGLRRAKHLLRRATFNFSKTQLDTLANMSATDAVNSIATNPANVLSEPYDPIPTSDPDGFWLSSSEHPNTFDGNSRKRAHITAWWWHNAMAQTSIKHKLSFFLHTTFTIGKDSGAGFPSNTYDHIRLLDHYALGNLKVLAKKITLDNAMLDYLNNTQNNKNNPNENYAREYLELFTILKGPQIGEGNYTNYTEFDIQQAAKVFSGFKTNVDRSIIDSDTGIPSGYAKLNQHNTSDKTFSAAFNNHTITGRNTAEGMIDELHDFVDMIFAQPETAKAYCRKLYRYFVKSTWNATVETDIIEPLAQILINNDYELLPVVKTLLSSEHFYDADDEDATDNIIGSIIKSPLQLVSEICSAFNVSLPDPETSALWYYRNFFQWFIHNNYFKASGMGLYNPDSVAGYPAYYQEPSFDRNWFSSNTLIGRYKIIESFILGRNTLVNSTPKIYATLDTIAFIENNIIVPSNPFNIVEEISELLYPESIDLDRLFYFKDFLTEGFSDYYWTSAWTQYQNTKSEIDKTAVKTRLDALITAMVNAPEFQLM